MAKKRPPIQQLREAGRFARDLLVQKGIERKDSVLAEIMNSGTTLPGIPPYLPHRWTLKFAQQIMRDFLVQWKEKSLSGDQREDVTEFFKFVVGELRRMESEYNHEIVNTPKLLMKMKEVPVLRDVFGPMNKKQTVRTMRRFLIDSFAVAIVLKNNHSTSEYANWFLDWTEEMYRWWQPPEERGKNKKTLV